MADDKTFPVLTEAEQARWDIARSSVRALSGEASWSPVSEESIEGTFNQLGQLKLDIPKILNVLHVPKNAGEYEDALTAILRRIPDGWGRWIECGPGWYPIIVETDAALAAIDPGYEVHQVKEKWGTLCYYAELESFGEAECDIRFIAEHPRPESMDDPEFQAWSELWETHCETQEHEEGFAAVYDPWQAGRDELEPKFDAIIKDAEKRSAVRAVDNAQGQRACSQSVVHRADAPHGDGLGGASAKHDRYAGRGQPRFNSLRRQRWPSGPRTAALSRRSCTT